MALELDGKIIKVLPEQTGEGRNGPWTKKEFVIETLGEFPKKVCFETWNEKVDVVKTLKEHDRVKVSFGIESREYNDKWYTNIRAWRIDKLVTNGAQTPPPENVPEPQEPKLPEDKEQDDLPF